MHRLENKVEEVIRCTVCGRKRSRLFESKNHFSEWAIKIPNHSPEPGEPEFITLCPKHKNETREVILADREGKPIETGKDAHEYLERIRSRANLN